MSRKYTDAEKAAYYKKLASQKKSSYKPRKTYTKPASAAGYKYRYKSSKAATKERTRRIESRKEPGYISAAGTMLGNLVHPIAGFLGGKLGHLVEQATGFGDYKLEYNSIMSGGMSPPQIVNAVNRGGVIVRHREFIADVKATQSFTLKSYLIQPGIDDTFPWLSQIANSYEQYKLRGVIFEFKSTSSDALLSTSTSTALGSVSMSTDYDVADLPPTSKKQMLNFEFSNSSKPSCTFMHPIECKKSQSAQYMLYTRSTVVPAGFDQRLYDFARFNIATEGMQADGGVLGELWVTYEVELYKQQFNFTGLADHFRFSNVTTARPLGTVIGSNKSSGGTIGGLVSGSGVDYSFPPDYSEGKYLINYSVFGSSTTITPVGVTPANAVLLSLWSGAGGVDNSNQQTAPGSATATQQTSLCMAVIQITAQGAGFGMSGAGVPPTSNSGDLWVVRLPDSIGPSNYLS